MREGGCVCGSVRYRAAGDPINERICHCRRCQRMTGSAFNARALYPESAVTIDGTASRFALSDDLDLGYCRRCGTSVVLWRATAGTIAVTAGTLDEPSSFRPSMHIFTSTSQPWALLQDGLPRHDGAPPAP